MLLPTVCKHLSVLLNIMLTPVQEDLVKKRLNPASDPLENFFVLDKIHIPQRNKHQGS